MTDTLQALLDRAAGFPDAGLRFLDRREHADFRPWSTIRDAAHEIGHRLLALGIEPGERVALVYPTGPDFIHAFFGILAAGAVPTPLYPPVRLGRLDEYHHRTARMLRAAGARLVLSDRRVSRILGRTLAEAHLKLGSSALGDLPPPAPGELPLADRDDLALVQFSSGTTSDPKPVALSQRAVLAQTCALNSFWPDDGSVHHSGVSWLPLYHDMGLIGCVFPALERPGVLTLLGPEVFVARPALWLRAISRYGATISVAPNFAYGLCVDKIHDDELEGVDLDSWRIALVGAEPIAPGVLDAFTGRFGRWGFRQEALTPVYGLSEASLAVTFSDLERPFRSRRFDRRRLAEGEAVEVGGVDRWDAPAEKDLADGVEMVSLGHPLPGFSVRCVDDNRRELLPGRVGRIEVRGPSLMEGYLGRSEESAAVLRNGWLDTGDLGFLYGGYLQGGIVQGDELFLTGRAKDVVILRGRNHAPEEIEHAVDGLAAARTGCAVAVGHLPEGANGERLLLFVERSRESRPEADDALRRVAAEAVLASTGLKTDEVHVLEPGTLPRTSSGKLRRAETLRRHLDGELLPPKRVTPWLVAGEMARSALARPGRPEKPEE